ncbi:MAG: L-serine ammonia-lyase, partial [Gluconacetobacter diazotrophicus]|nr:L-serine ammonia-lyase [Gluconacetobacter diazotrophicus]
MPNADAVPTDPRGPSAISVADLYTIGIGPSSSHTVGPMRAALRFAILLAALSAASRSPVSSLRCTLFGSLALTGAGHATDRAVILGLSGHAPETLDPDAVPMILSAIAAAGALPLAGGAPVPFRPAVDLDFDGGTFHPGHPNTLRFDAVLADGAVLSRCFHSIGGGVVTGEGEGTDGRNISLPHPFASAAELLERTAAAGLTIAGLVAANELAWREPHETVAFLDAVRAAMSASIDRGCAAEGLLPGGLRVRRRARDIHRALRASDGTPAPQVPFEWVSLWALAVNEENAAGGRVVTAPTNGAAGVLPAVLRYYECFTPEPTEAGARDFLLTAAAIGMLYKKRASISAAEMGCQGEVGVACSMAAGALCAVLGGTPFQVENAAEIGMEHNLGLTCDPIGGLVQIPCIERNTMGAIKAI